MKQRKDEKTSALLLLDDAAEKGEQQDWHTMTKASLKPPAQASAPKQKAAQLPATKAPKSYPGRPTLRQLMQEYNRPISRFSALTAKTPDSTGEGFTFERIQQINLPGISGKILRPAKKTR